MVGAVGCSGSTGNPGGAAGATPGVNASGADTSAGQGTASTSGSSVGDTAAGDSASASTTGGADATGGDSVGNPSVDDPTGAGTGIDVLEPGVPDPSFINARIRRVTNTEFDRTVSDVLGTDLSFEADLVPNSRQQGFTLNAQQIVDPVLATQLQEAASVLADEAVSDNLAQLAPCATASPDAACASEFIESFLPRAYRRPITDADRLRAQALYEVGAEQGFENGLRLLIQGVLQSASFLYHTELGDEASPSASTTTMTQHEIAAALSYIITQGPPDAELTAAAAASTLTDPAVRESQARRLLGSNAAEDQIARLVTEWIGVDRVIEKGKDAERFADVGFDELRHSMLDETKSFAKEVTFRGTGTLTELLTADYTVVDSAMASFYGTSTGMASLSATPRRGLLNHASFLATYASEIDSAPVRRGSLVLRHIACIDPGDPNLLDIEVVPPAPDPNSSTRQRFAQHVTDVKCSGCHRLMDPIGFSFENYDAVGQQRDTDNGQPVDTNGAFDLAMTDLGTATFADSAEMVALLAQSDDVKECFARHLFRFASAQSTPGTEDTFLREWAGLEVANQDKLLEILAAFAQSDLFVQRGVQ